MSKYSYVTDLGPVTKEQEDLLRDRVYNFFNVEDVIKYLQGQVLTFIESSTQDAEQRKAQKDMIKILFNQCIKDEYDSCFKRGAQAQSTKKGPR